MNPSPDRNGPPARDRGITARRMARTRVVVGGATIAVALAVALAAFGFTWSPAAPAPPSASSSSDPSLPLASPKFFHSDGPYIGEQRAKSKTSHFVQHEREADPPSDQSVPNRLRPCCRLSLLGMTSLQIAGSWRSANFLS